MADVYTPTKTLDGTPFSPVESPAVYIPTRIDSTPDGTTPQKLSDIRQRYGAGEAYSPSNPGIRIVKRKPKASTETETPLGKLSSGKRPANDDDIAIAALRSHPKKSILRDSQQQSKRPARRIFFADTRGLPLVAVKEIEKIAAIHHSSSLDFRTFERNEGSAFCREPSPDEPDWGLLRAKRSKPLRTELSETGKREERRIQELGLLRGAMFGACTLEDDPALTELAMKDLASSKPVLISTTSISSDHSVINTLRELPLPGRGRAGDLNQRQHSPATRYTNYNKYEQVSSDTSSTVYQATLAPSEKQNVIKQIFSDSSSGGNYYSAVQSAESGKPEEPEVQKQASKIELPANLREMLNQLKKKGFVSSEDSQTTTTSTAPLAAAMQTAKQMFQNQQNPSNSYTTETAPQEYQGYIGSFATSDMTVQEQDSGTPEEWTRTQGNWRIQEPCSFHVNRLNGCNRGDQCKYLHDDDLRKRNLSSNHGVRGGFQRDHDERDRGFRNDRGGRRGNFRGGFRSSHQDRDFRDRQGFGNRDRYQTQDRFNNFRRNEDQTNFGRSGFTSQRHQVESYAIQEQQPSHASPEYQQLAAAQSEQGSVGFSGYQAQIAAPTQQQPEQQSGGHGDNGFTNKPMRRSRFDQRDNAGSFSTRDVDHRPQRRNRFDEEQSQSRPFRSRFDEGPKDQDDRTPVEYQAQWAPPQ